MKKLHVFSGLRDFFVLWGSQTLSSLGTAMTNFALIIWVYGQGGTASSITSMTICSFLPTILFRFIAGTFADRWDKKWIMLVSDLLAACGTLTILLLHSLSSLEIWHLYVINFLLSLMNSFQVPAANVATGLLVPQEQYTRVSGLQSFAGSVVSILAPALGSVLLALGGLNVVLLFDLASFAVAFLTLLFSIQIPDGQQGGGQVPEPFWKSCMEGIRFLRNNAAVWRLILFFAAVNFLAKLGNDGMLPPFVLGKTDGDQNALGLVQSAVALGILAGSLFVTLMRPAKRKTTAIFVSCAITFLTGGVLLGLSGSLPLWMAASFASYVPVAILGANLTVIMRTRVPVQLQGRVFSARDTIQNGTIPLGLFLGGVLADYVLEPFMGTPSPVQQVLSSLFGTGKGAGIAVLFFIVGSLGAVMSIVALRNPLYRELD